MCAIRSWRLLLASFVVLVLGLLGAGTASAAVFVERPASLGSFILGVRAVSTHYDSSLYAYGAAESGARDSSAARLRDWPPSGPASGLVELFVRPSPGGVAAKTVPEVVGPARSTDLVLDSFRGLGPGKQKTVRTVGSVDEMRSTFDAWSVGAERLPARGAKVPDVYRLPDGGVIQWRTGSGTGGPTIDIFPTSGPARTVHLADGAPW